LFAFLLACSTPLATPADSSALDTADTAATGSDTGDTDTGRDSDAPRYHPVGFDASSVHGMEAKLQEQDCRSCHGADLDGGTADVSCDSCHHDGWRTDCTFCHGGSDNGTGAPPEAIDDADDDAAFGAHTSHVTEGIHAAFDCAQCHVHPSDALSSGHLFVGDSTPGVAEVKFSGGYSADASWSGGGCSSVYCHGNGNGSTGDVKLGDDVQCGTCHAVEASWWTGGWLLLGGEHIKHLWSGYLCADCHADTVSSGDTIADPAKHVNGQLDVALPAGMAWDGSSCTGSCHGETHSGRGW